MWGISWWTFFVHILVDQIDSPFKHRSKSTSYSYSFLTPEKFHPSTHSPTHLPAVMLSQLSYPRRDETLVPVVWKIIDRILSKHLITSEDGEQYDVPNQAHARHRSGFCFTIIHKDERKIEKKQEECSWPCSHLTSLRRRSKLRWQQDQSES